MLDTFANLLSGGTFNKLKSANESLLSELNSTKLSLAESKRNTISLKGLLETEKTFSSAKDVTISDLKKEIENLKANLSERTAEKKMYEDGCLEISKEIGIKDNKINELENLIKSQNIEIEQLSSEVDALKNSKTLLEEQLKDLNENNDVQISDNGTIDNNESEEKEQEDIKEPAIEPLNVTDLIDRLQIQEREKQILDEKLSRSVRKYEKLQIEFGVANSNIEFYKKRIEELENELNTIRQIEDKTEESLMFVVNIEEDNSSGNIITQDAHVIPEQLKIEKVIDIEDGDGTEIDAREFFAQSEDTILHMRRKLQDAIIFDRPKYVCKYCGQMVKISGRNTERGRASFFSHLYDSDACDLKTTTGLSQAFINARKYGKYGESQQHIKLKKNIEDALRDTNSIKKGITDVQKEKTVFGSHPLFKWRRPDIFFKYNDKEIVLEIQLSTTFASVIAEREMFYRMNDIFIIWVFNFDKNQEHVDLRNLMMKDIYYENHRNVFILDEEAIEEGLKRKELVLKCDWLEPDGRWHHSGYENYGCKGEFVTLSDLKYNIANYKPYYHDISTEQNLPVYDDSKELQNSPTKKIIDLLDKRYQKILERQQQDDLKRKTILDALDIDAIEHEYVRLKVATVKKDNRYGLYNFVNKTEIMPPVYRSIKLWNNSRFFLVEDENKKIGLVNADGEPVVPIEYDSISKPEDGTVVGTYRDVSEGIKMSSFICMNNRNNFTINKGFVNLEQIGDSNIYISTKKNNDSYLKGLISKSGYIIADNIYTNVFVFSNGLFAAVLNGKYGIIDDRGQKVIPFIYDRICAPVDGKAQISLDENSGFIDSEGHFIYDARISVKTALGTEKRKFLNSWRVYDRNNRDLSRHGYEEICHYQGHIVSFSSNEIVSDKNIWADRECGLEAVLTEKTKTGYLFKFGSRIAKMNRRQLQNKPEDITYEVGKIYTVYISCIKEDLNLVYLSPVPCFGPSTRNRRTTFYRKRY